MALCLANDLYENVTYNVYNHPKPYVKLADNSDGFEVHGHPLPEHVETGSYIFGWTSRSRIVSLVNMYIDQRRHQAPAQADDLADIDAPLLYVPADRIANPNLRQHVADTYRLNELIMAAMKRKIEAALGPDRFAVMLVPMRWDFPGSPPRPDAVHDTVANGVMASLSHLGIPAIDGRTVLTPDDFWARDIHWRPSGHKKIGAQLGGFLAKLID
jgi:hypothetical protein